jgi:hypothetical protein
MKKIIFILAFTVTGCTDAEWDNMVSSYGNSATVECYSGGDVVFQAVTTGKVGSLSGGGWAFRTIDGRFVQTFADCFVEFRK